MILGLKESSTHEKDTGITPRINGVKQDIPSVWVELGGKEELLALHCGAGKGYKPQEKGDLGGRRGRDVALLTMFLEQM